MDTRSPSPQADAGEVPSGLADSWEALADAEAAVLSTRQGHAKVPRPRIGLAISGGGVRSATFGLGLLRGMAQSPTGPPAPSPAAAGSASNAASDTALLGRLDYLSTVSGGGYVGAMYGRLVDTYGVARALELMAGSRSTVLGWLRRNGRYLTPAGSRDIGIAVVTYLRAWLAIHTEFMFACILLGLVVVTPHLWQHSFQQLDPQAWEPWYTPWWVFAASLWGALAPGAIAGYWAARDAPNPGSRHAALGWKDGIFVLLLAVVAWWLVRTLHAQGALNPLRNGLSWPGIGALALVSVVVGQLSALVWLALDPEPHALKVARLRNRLTRALRVVMLASAALAAAGALDRLSWWFLEEFQSGNAWLWRGVGVGSLSIIVLRALVQPLQKMAADSTNGKKNAWLPRLLNIGSMLGLLALVTAWMVLLQWFVFAPETFEALRAVPAWMRAGMLFAVWAIWILLSAANTQMANTSSLHSFYRARLTRAYLAVGNPERQLADTNGVRADVTRVVDGDDTALLCYRPELRGGPIHLVNACLNQTRDDSSGLYNADRKGTLVTASWRGFEVGTREFISLKEGHDAGTLGRWVAVSGAAASPGAGSYTSRGLALLLYFLGVRLGHWMQAPGERVQLRWGSALGWRLLTKPMMLASEASATFFGVERPWWYLSDGGHFENTGVYPLLKRELDFIILSDAGADALYEFGDLENLVRKARIDFGAEIDFYTREEAAKLFSLHSPELTVLSPEDMGNSHSSRGVLLARIRYRERPGPADRHGQPTTVRPEGTLLVVKPNLHDALDVDLLAYAQKHPAFPHESTGDQSFDEAQWESYHRLGEDFGRAMQASWLAQLPGWRTPARHGLRVAARLGEARAAAASAPTEPLWRRNARAAAIGTTLGVGASGTLLISLWQVQDQLQRNQSDQQTEARTLFTEVSRGLQNFKGTCPEVPEHVVTQAALLLDLRGSPTMRPLEQAGLERLVGRIAEECTQQPEASPSCTVAYERVQTSLCALVLKPRTENTAFNYWHPGASPQEQMRDSQRVLQGLAARFPVFGLANRGKPEDLVAASADGDAYDIGVAPPPRDEDSAANIAAAQAQADTAPTAPTAPATPAAPAAPTAAAAGAAPPATGAAAPAPAPVAPPSTGAAPPPPGDTTATVRATGAGSNMVAVPTLQNCQRGNGRSTLYIHIYSEASRLQATTLQLALQSRASSPLVVAPIENVTRSADLRQQRRPVPWPQATLVLHDAESRDCARAIAGYVGAPWVGADSSSRVRLRMLSRSLQGTPGVIELWLPPVGEGPGAIAQAALPETR